MALFRTKRLTLAIADEMATLAVSAAKANKFAPIAVTVMDPDGGEIVTKRMDGCPVSVLVPAGYVVSTQTARDLDHALHLIYFYHRLIHTIHPPPMQRR